MAGRSRCTRRAFCRTGVSGSRQWEPAATCWRPTGRRPGSISAGTAPCFVAAAEAADPDRPLWLHDRLVSERSTLSLRTQRRWVHRCGRILGLAGGLSRRAAELVAEALGLGGTMHQQARSQWAAARDIRGRSVAVVTVLTLVGLDQSLLFRLLAAGYISSALPSSCLWSSEASALVFPGAGTLPPGAGRCRPPPSFDIGSP